MRRSGRVLLGVGFVVAASSCSLFVSVDGLQTNVADGGTLDAATDAPLIEASTDGSIDAGADAAVFFDDFNRPDNALIGNAWIEKDPKAFLLAGGKVVRQDNDSLNFPDNLVYRPSTEDVLDVEASVEFTLTGTPGYPQVWTRIQKDTIIQSGVADGYGLAVSGSAAQAALFRSDPVNGAVQLTQFNITPTLDTTHTYRLRLRTTGTTPVQIATFVESQVDATTWNVIAMANYTDSDPMAVALPGSVGFSAASGDATDLYLYDNFTRSAL